MVHCCEKMDFFLQEKRVEIYYNQVYREYSIGLKSPRNGRLGIYNCPWCGYKFEKSLVIDYHTILEKELGIYRNPITGLFYEKIINDAGNQGEFYVGLPFGFDSDLWWKKWGL